ncbi:TadE/TadG family type IV pilus assembly protein [Methylobacterium durans]|uniref:Uncharacterized protein n=1 Tax=Methylobacterium durans TaxID=2202825 RepID=A0A2U8W6G7_9HYPH|nr:hypothetical protein [Methylobacterium durans]AWN41667.1 hypothetical protein DK389_15575 [Methylobacterium durans]
MFRQDERGGVAIILAFALPMLLVGVGGALEASREATYRNRVASATELACRQAQSYVNANKPDDVKVGDTSKTYPTQVQDIAARNFQAKGLTSSATVTATNTDTNVHVQASGSQPLVFGTLLRKSTFSVSMARDCAVISTAVAITTGANAPELLISESFERPSHSVNYNSWDVLGGARNSNTWNGWGTVAAGIEINGQRELASNSIRFGDFFAELDSDCNTAANSGVSGCRSNSSMNRTLNLTAGSYQIRYWYIARLRDAARPGQVICGTKSSDVDWYTVEGQTNRIEVYVDKEKSGGGYNLSNLVDVCVQADAWTERVINFTVAATANYRITWKAAGREDTYGGLIDYLRICRNACPG